MTTKFYAIIPLLLISIFSSANNIVITNASLSGQNTTAKTSIINFDVSWENSWRTSTNENNYDGAWIFVKYRKNGTTDWRHATISLTGATPASGAAFSIPTDGKGAFIHRSGNGIGNVSYAANQLVWTYGTDGILDNETVEIRVFALEMVYIPIGSFQLGSGGSEANTFQDGTSGIPYTVASNAAINLGTTAATLNPNGMGAASGTLPAAYPKGYNAFWVMKYECTQQQYVDFLNHLDLSRASVNTQASFFTGTHPNLVASAPERAMQFIGMNRTAAIADWSGLRPMTELEFEKTARGYNTPAVPNEYVWGTTAFVALSTVTNFGLSNETVATPVAANANVVSIYGNGVSVRAGLFARTAGSDRSLSGSTYYGVLNMGDNVTEVCATISNAAGRLFDAAVHGDGYVAASGNSDIATWTNFQAYGTKGGAYNSGTQDMQTSRRANSNIFTISYGTDSNQPNMGCRLVRTAP